MASEQHIEFSTLTDLVEERLSDAEHQSVMAHLAACPQCAAQRAKIDEMISLMRSPELEEAPRYAIAQAINLFRSHQKQPASLLQRLVALLQFDSQQMTPAYGVRSTAMTERQMLFTAGDYELQLQIAGESDGWVISGQLLGDCASGAVELKSRTLATQTTLNELCEFTLPAMPAGDYALTLRLNTIEIEVQNLTVGA
jgi:hypothetical protein